MSQQHGKAGQGAYVMAFERELIILGCAIAIFVLGWIWTKNAASIASLGLPAVVVLVVGFRLLVGKIEKNARHVQKRAKHAERGAKAEERVAEKMSELPEGFTVFHDLLFPGFNIDHVVVGLSGIYLIETKSHRGRLTNTGDQLLIDGNPPEKDFIKQTWSQAYQLKDFLKAATGQEVSVKPILCFSAAYVQTRQPVKGVAVINSKFLNELLARQKPSLDAETMSRVVQALEKKVAH